MEPSTMIAIYMPIFMMLFVIIPSLNTAKRKQMIINRRRNKKKMENQLLKEYEGRRCNISTGLNGKVYKNVKILSVVETWMKIEKKGMEELINTDYIQYIKMV